MDLLTNQNQSYICMLVHTCDICTYAPVGPMGTLRETIARFRAHANYTVGKHKGSRHKTQIEDADALRPSARDTKEQRSAQPCGWGPPGAHVRSPPTPQAAHPESAAPPQKRTPNLAAGTREPPGGSLRAAARPRPPAQATGSRRFGGGSKGARQPAPQSPERPARSPRPRWLHSSLTPRHIPRGPPAPAPPLLTRARCANASASPEPQPPPSLWRPRPRHRHLGTGRK